MSRHVWTSGKFNLMSQDGIFASRLFNMSGFEIEQNGKVIPEGQIFYGANFILEKETGFILIIQQVKNGDKINKTPLKAKTQRSARMEINKLFPVFKGAYSKPRFIKSIQYLAKLEIQNENAGMVSN